VDCLHRESKNLIRSYPGFPGFSGFGDWLNINAETPNDLIGTAFFAHSADLLSRVASVLGKEDDAATYGKLFEDVRAAFVARYVTPAGLISTQTQTAYLLALHFNLAPEGVRSTMLEELIANIQQRGNKLSTGFVGSPYLNHVLTEGGRSDVAFALLNQKEWPSWLYAVTQGATTIWERWDGWTHDKGFQDVGMNSFNHYAYGAIGAWLYQSVAGIDLHPEVPAYRHVVMRPRIGGGLTSAKGTYLSNDGKIESSWTVTDGKLAWDVVVPPNAVATAYVPGSEVSVSGDPAESQGADGDRSVYRLAAGRYRFESTL